MEKELKINISKKVTVYGRFQGVISKPLFIVVHGLPGSMSEGFYEKAAQWFGTHGFSTFRFNLYSWQKDARELVDCTLEVHASDIDAIVAYFRKRGFKKIFVAGHSFGGASLLLSKKQGMSAVALWDPSYDLSFTKRCYGSPGGEYVKQLDGYFMKWGVDVIISKKMAEEADTLRWDELPKKFHVPVMMFAAEKGVLTKGIKKYFSVAHEPKAMTIIKGATHYFDDKPGMQEKVFALTKKWFDQFR
jgi:dienelactone hydrolase